MGIFKKRDKSGLSQAEVDALAQKYIVHEADRLRASPVYKEFVAWAEGNGLHAIPDEDTTIPWQGITGKNFRLKFFPVILAGSDPVQISFFYAVIEDLSGRSEDEVVQVQPSLTDLQEVMDGIRPGLNPDSTEGGTDA